MKHPKTADTEPPVMQTADSLTKRCTKCGQRMSDETVRHLEGYELNKNVFAWSVMTVVFWGTALTLPIQWTVAWWTARPSVALLLVVMPVVAIYFWVLFLRERRKK